MSVQVVVAYDIGDDKRRSKVAECLEGYGVRVNYSVFECVVKPRAFLEMKRELENLIDQDSDGVRFYNVFKTCVQKTELMGPGPSPFSCEQLVYV